MRGFHRIRVDHIGDSAAADRLREYLHRSGYVLVPDSSYSVRIQMVEGKAVGLDSVDSLLEARILANLEDIDTQDVLLRRKGGNRDPQVAIVTTPVSMADQVARAVFRAIEQVSNQASLVEAPRPAAVTMTARRWWQVWR